MLNSFSTKIQDSSDATFNKIQSLSCKNFDLIFYADLCKSCDSNQLQNNLFLLWFLLYIK